MMKRKRICALLLAAALLVGAAGCTVQEPAPSEPEQTGYVMDEGLLTMTVDWTVDTRDRRSERFESAVFAEIWSMYGRRSSSMKSRFIKRPRSRSKMPIRRRHPSWRSTT